MDPNNFKSKWGKRYIELAVKAKNITEGNAFYFNEIVMACICLAGINVGVNTYCVVDGETLKALTTCHVMNPAGVYLASSHRIFPSPWWPGFWRVRYFCARGVHRRMRPQNHCGRWSAPAVSQRAQRMEKRMPRELGGYFSFNALLGKAPEVVVEEGLRDQWSLTDTTHIRLGQSGPGTISTFSSSYLVCLDWTNCWVSR